MLEFAVNNGMIRIHFVPDSSGLPPPKQQTQATAKIKISAAQFKHYNRFGRPNAATTRSMPVSPAIRASRSALNTPNPPTSIPPRQSEKAQKLQALRIPMIHLLAVRPVSTKFLAQKICCPEQDCLDVLEKVGRKHSLDSSKWDLLDRSFKELDIFKFPYPQDDDRQLAINRAISAFDRMRLSREEKVWQMLLPADERGKGKVLSKLNLHAGPIPKSGTPRINLQPTEDPNGGGQETGNDSDRRDRLAPSDAEPMARSSSHDQPKKTKISEREQQSKRLLAKNPKKAAPATKPKESQAKGKKATGRKAPAASSATGPKSTEFVHDSDEDEDMTEVQAVPVQSTASSTLPPNEKQGLSDADREASSATSAESKAGQTKTSSSQPKSITSKPTAGMKKPGPPSSSGSGANRRLSDGARSAIPMVKSLSRQRTTSSPHKPSPLSSPPTNASDLEMDGISYQASSNSSTPLLAQPRKNTFGSSAAAPRPGPVLGHPVDNPSDRDLKRKANDVESGIHNQDLSFSGAHPHSTKRHKSSILSPPTSESGTGGSPPLIDAATLNRAKQFKRYYAKYEQLYQEVAGCPGGSEANLQKLLDMHHRLIALKSEIASSAP